MHHDQLVMIIKTNSLSESKLRRKIDYGSMTPTQGKNNHKCLIFGIYVDDTYPPYDLLGLETAPTKAAIKAIATTTTQASNTAIKVTTTATKSTAIVHSSDARLWSICIPKDAPLKGGNKSMTREDTWPA